MTGHVFNDAYQALNLTRSADQPIQKNENAGRLNFRIVTVIVLGGATILSAVAAIVAAIFAAYLVAAVAGGALLLLAFSTIMTSQIDFSSALKDLIKKMTQRIKDLFKEIEELKKQPPTPINVNPNRELELMRQIEELKSQKNEVIQPPVAKKEIDKQEVILKENLELKDEIEKLKKKEPLKNHDEDLIHQLKNEIDELKKRLKDSDELLKKRESELNEKKEELKQILNPTEELNPSAISELKEMALQYEQKDGQIKDKLEKKNKKNKKAKAKERKEISHELFAIKQQIILLEKTEFHPLNPIEITEEISKKITPILKEVIATEKSYLLSIKKMPPYFDSLKQSKLIESDEYKDLTAKWDDLVTQSELLIKSLEILDNPEAKIIDKLIVYRNVFFPGNIKIYFNSHLKILTSNLHLKIINQEGSEIYKTCINQFSTNYGVSPSNFSIMPVQRIPRHVLLMKDLLKNANFPEGEVRNAFAQNLAYIEEFGKLINALNPLMAPRS